MPLLVTGGTGFIGRHLVRQLANRTSDQIRVVDVRVDAELSKELPKVRFYKLDITLINTAQWERLLEGVSVVYHLSGLLGTSELFNRIIEAERVFWKL
jgi:nucleoside-diphosphate-sugar epimerase